MTKTLTAILMALFGLLGCGVYVGAVAPDPGYAMNGPTWWVNNAQWLVPLITAALPLLMKITGLDQKPWAVKLGAWLLSFLTPTPPTPGPTPPAPVPGPTPPAPGPVPPLPFPIPGPGGLDLNMLLQMFLQLFGPKLSPTTVAELQAAAAGTSQTDNRTFGQTPLDFDGPMGVADRVTTIYSVVVWAFSWVKDNPEYLRQIRDFAIALFDIALKKNIVGVDQEIAKMTAPLPVPSEAATTAEA